MFHKEKFAFLSIHFFYLTICERKALFISRKSKKDVLIDVSHSARGSKQLHVFAHICLSLNFLNFVQTLLICIVFFPSRIQNTRPVRVCGARQGFSLSRNRKVHQKELSPFVSNICLFFLLKHGFYLLCVLFCL